MVETKPTAPKPEEKSEEKPEGKPEEDINENNKKPADEQEPENNGHKSKKFKKVSIQLI